MVAFALVKISPYTFSAVGIAFAICVSVLGAAWGIYISGSSLIGAAIKAPHITSKNLIRIMTLSKKLTAVDELMSCDPLYLAKAGRERQRYDFDDFDPVPQKFNI